MTTPSSKRPETASASTVEAPHSAAPRPRWILAEPRDVPGSIVPASGNDGFAALVTELVGQVDAADPTQAGHSVRVAALATMLGSAIGMAESELRSLRVAALLHDVGKIAVPADILRKSSTLTVSEASTVRRHTVYGGAILRRIPVLAFAASTARWHHERWDGLGYPDGLVGHAIPLPARIVAVADALDAMTSVRPYRAAIAMDAAFEELEAHAGAQFDPLIVSAAGSLVGADGFRNSWDSLIEEIESLPVAA